MLSAVHPGEGSWQGAAQHVQDDEALAETSSPLTGLHLARRAILIPDVFVEPRVPHAAYRPTFVRSMAMYPIGLIEPVMAVGTYWSTARIIDTGTDTMLATLARFAGVTLGRIACANAA